MLDITQDTIIKSKFKSVWLQDVNTFKEELFKETSNLKFLLSLIYLSICVVLETIRAIKKLFELLIKILLLQNYLKQLKRKKYEN